MSGSGLVYNIVVQQSWNSIIPVLTSLLKIMCFVLSQQFFALFSLSFQSEEKV